MGKNNHNAERHHRKPCSLGGKNDSENISKVSRKAHRSWHNLFVNYDARTICGIINALWLDPDYSLVCVKKENANRVVEFNDSLKKKKK